MTDHDLRQRTAAELLRAGKDAFGNRDKQLLRECLRELECRSSRAAAAAEEELRALARSVGRSRTAGSNTDDPIDAIALVKDTDIAYRRGSMIENAKRSIWLSSLTFPHSDLVPLLADKARSRVSVAIVVAGRQVQARHDAEVRRLTAAGARCMFPASTHSKALVVDEELVLLGSANAHGGHRDLCVSFRDCKTAAEIIEYLDGLAPKRTHLPQLPTSARRRS